MRPAGEIRQALLDAALALFTPERSPTMLELAMHAQVGRDAARRTIYNMRRAGVLERARDRKVTYRNKPVAEYCPRPRMQQKGGQACPLRDAVGTWSASIA
jgi:DNA-binding transcriptional regulator YhcF (GntR family)